MKKRTDGRYQINIRLPDGKRKSFYGKTQKEVKEKAARFESEHPDRISTETVTFKEWAKKWMRDYTASLKPQTIVSYQNNIDNYLIPYFGDYDLRAIRPIGVQDFVIWLTKKTSEKTKKPLSAKTVKNITGTLHRCLDQARKFELIESNPADRVDLPKRKKPDLQYLEPDDIPTLLAATKGDRFDTLYRTALLSGMRQGELLAICWADVDFAAGVIRVHRNKNVYGTDLDKKFSNSTKTGKDRNVHIPKSLVSILRRHRADQLEYRMMVGQIYDNRDLVFANDDGSSPDARTISKHFRECAKAAGYDRLRFHDLRHTYAVTMLQAGVDIKIVSENLGHSSTAFTNDVYAFATKRGNNEAMEALEEAVKNVF